MDRHPCCAEHHGDIDRDIIECRHVGFCDFARAKYKQYWFTTVW